MICLHEYMSLNLSQLEDKLDDEECIRDTYRFFSLLHPKLGSEPLRSVEGM